MTYPDASTDVLELSVTVVPVVVAEVPVETPGDDETDTEVIVDSKQEAETTEDLPKAGESEGLRTLGVIVTLAGSVLLFTSKMKKPEEVN